ncbi:MAG: long-chain fatty acid--CoA ligase [Syntrophomonadaceae bacterium]|nr:long-chain fatty acid--CoA ligase [Syntrophomonadaceae bacterium]
MKSIKEWTINQQTFPELFNDRVIKFGAHTCQLWKKPSGEIGSLTYSQVGRIVKEMAAGIMRLGVRAGDRVALMSYNCPEWLWSDFSILNSGAVTVTIYPSQSGKEVAFIVNDSGARILYVQNEMMLQKALDEWDAMPTLEKVIIFEEGVQCDNPNVLSLEQLRAIGVRHLVQYPLDYERRWRAVDIHDLMTIIYTSGTTGRQKGVMHTHFSINAALCRDQRWSIEFFPDDVLLSFLPLAHSYERECGMFRALASGVAIAYAQNPATVMQDIQTFRPTVFMSVPRIYERIFVALRDAASATSEGAAAFEAAIKIGVEVVNRRANEDGTIDMSEGIDLTEGLDEELKAKYLQVDAAVFSKVRAVLGGKYRCAWSAAAALNPDLNKLFLAMGIRVMEGYGLTESCNTICCSPINAILPGTIGPVNAGVEIKLDEDGELLARGDIMFIGYWNQPDETAAAFTEDGYFRTGDIAEILPNGYVKIVDRKKTIIVLDTGKNVASSKVERQFAVSSWIDQAFPVGDDRKYIGALVVPNFDAFINYFNKEGIPFDESQVEYMGEGAARVCVKAGDDFIQNEQLKVLVAKEVETANQGLEEFERIKKYEIVSRKFSEALDEVTPTLKTKKNVIIKNFKAEIDKIYS